MKCVTAPKYWMQTKFDGHRIIVKRHAGKVTCWSRTGKQTIALPKAVVAAALKTALDFILDGEIVDATVFAFDLLEVGGVNVQSAPYEQRLEGLEMLLKGIESGIVCVTSAKTTQEKIALFEATQKTGGEGVVIKDKTAKYTPGRPNSGGPCLKYKFLFSASVIVSAHHKQHRSVRIRMHDGTEVGGVTIPPNKEVPPVGAVIEVRYLYAYKGGSLFQTVYLGERDDIDPAECVMGQLKYKNEAKEEA